MKVTNNKINPGLAKTDAGKSQKVDASPLSELENHNSGVKSAKNARSSANVDVSERAQLMQKAKDIASKSSVDEAKVARLQKMIDEGKYKVDADAVADRMVNAHMEFPE